MLFNLMILIQLQNVKLPASIKKVGVSAFAYCKSITEIPAGIEEIGENAFSGCSGLENITIKKNVKYGKGCFGRHDIKKIIVEDGIEVFDFDIFTAPYPISNLSIGEVILPESVKEIRGYLADRFPFESLTINSSELVSNVEFHSALGCKIQNLYCKKAVYEANFSQISNVFVNVKLLDFDEVVVPPTKAY